MLALDVLAQITPALEVMGEEEMNDFNPAALIPSIAIAITEYSPGIKMLKANMASI